MSLVDEAARHIPLPGFVKRHLIRSRQRTLFTKGDGVTPATWDHVEKIYLDSLEHLGAIFATRPYLLGTRPSLADFGFMGPMFRHFAMDPPSARIMRETAPAVFEWVARVWNARASVTGGELLSHVPDDWGTHSRFDWLGLPPLPLRKRRSLEARSKPFRRRHRRRTLPTDPDRALSRWVSRRTSAPLRKSL